MLKRAMVCGGIIQIPSGKNLIKNNIIYNYLTILFYILSIVTVFAIFRIILSSFST